MELDKTVQIEIQKKINQEQMIMQSKIIVNDKQKNIISEKLLAYKKLEKEIKDTFRPIVKKAHEAHKEAKAQENKYLQPVQEFMTHAKKLLSQYALEQNKKLEEERKKIEKDQPVRAMAMPEKTQQKEGISVVDNWQFEITDPEKVPFKYWMIDERMIRAEVKTSKEKTNIPGVKVFNAGTVRVKS